MSHYSGEIAALATACCWSCTSVCFSLAGKKIGSASVNRIRLQIAFITLALVHLLVFRTPFPFAASPRQFFWLGLSGLIGFALGDAFLFEALVLVGARLSMLVMLLAPIIGTILAWICIGEHLTPGQMAAIMLTMSGIAWVVSETEHSAQPRSPKYLLGILCAVGGAAGQAGGMLLAKIGMRGGFSPISANLIRLAAASMVMTALASGQGSNKADWLKMKDRHPFLLILAGALAGPVLGVVLGLFAVVHAQLGIAATLMALAPVILLPAAHFFFREHISARSVLGTIIAIAGAALLFLL